MQQLVECVPNFSEGRDRRVIDAIAEAARQVDGVRVLDVDPGADTHRTVLTFVGSPAAVVEAAFQVIRLGAELIDMRRHHGEHPRHGAVDVCPFVPVAGVTMADCAGLARRLGERVGAELGIPVYLYEHAATQAWRRNLAALRRGEYEALSQKLGTEEWAPDYGPNAYSDAVARTGVVTIGAREFLIAYNVNLSTRDKRYATDIAFAIRDKGRTVRVGNIDPDYFRGEILRYRPSAGVMPCGQCDHVAVDAVALTRHYREAHDFDWPAFLETWNQPIDRLDGRPVKQPGQFRHCKATGWVIEQYGRAQVTMNLTDYHVTPPHLALEACRALARARRIVVTGSELVGMIPFDALYQAGEYYLARHGGCRGLPWRDVLEMAVRSMGLNDVAPFDVDTRVIGLPERPARCLMALPTRDFVDEVSRESPAPGGGSVAALAGALGASLASMVANLSVGKVGYEAINDALDALAVRAQSLRERLSRAVDTDTEAFNAVLAGVRLPQGTPEQKARRTAAIQDGYRAAVRVPLETAQLCLEVIGLADVVARKGNRASVTDAGVAALMACSGVEGAVYNVRINLPAVTDAAFVAERSAELEALVSQARAQRDAVDAFVVGTFSERREREASEE